MTENHWIFKLKKDWEQITPDVWDEIQAKIASRIADELLRDLEGLPSPEGRLFEEIREHAKQQMHIKGA